jgi:Cu(I)/Ag(I) efflux system membrane protein CusA/SilA
MTVATMTIGLVPIMWSTGAGSDVMKRIAAPLLGGILTSFLLELLIYPTLFQLWKWHAEVRPETEAAVAVHQFGAARIRPPRLG